MKKTEAPNSSPRSNNKPVHSYNNPTDFQELECDTLTTFANEDRQKLNHCKPGQKQK